MKFIKLLPFNSVLNNEELPVALWKKELSDFNLCEFQTSQDLKKIGNCDTSGYYYGADDETEPKFCARHFYQLVVSGNGKTNYKLK